MVYERVAPEGRCVSPDGHDCTEEFRFGDPIPLYAVCGRCGKSWDIVTFEADDA